MGNLAEALVAVTRPESVLTGPDLAALTIDQRGTHQGLADALVRPRTTEEVAAVVRVAADEGAVVVAQGGNTGLSGGAVPSPTGPTVILALTSMREIESVDAARYTATVQAGVTIADIQEAARTADRLFAPDWGARGTATIGGAISTNAGGLNVLRFGTMREHILGLEVVLPDGRIWNGLRALRKDSSGYDLKHLFIGAEGTLGVVTRAVVRLLPRFGHEQTAFAALPGLVAVGDLLDLALTATPGGLTAFELIPERGVASMVDRFERQRPIATVADWYVMIRLSGSSPVTDVLGDLLTSAAEAGLVTDAVVASTPSQEENLWTIRDEVLPGVVFENYRDALKMDAAVPLDRIAEFLDRLDQVAAEWAPGAERYAFGHVGDGNLHCYVVPAVGDEPRFRELIADLRDVTDRLIWDMGGTLSAEHGVGQLLRERIGGQKSAVEIELAHSLKQLLDPHGRLNPDKTLPVRARQGETTDD